MARAGIVFLHGVRSSSTMWRRHLGALQAARRIACAPDLPGHGRRRGTGFTLDGALAVVEDAAGDLAASGAPVVVVGQSLGGYVGLHWAARTGLPVAGVLAAGCSTLPAPSVVGAYRLAAAAVALLPDHGAWLNDRLAAWTLPAAGARDAAAGGYALDVMQDVLRAIARVRPLEDIRSLGPVPVWIVNGAWDHFRAQERAYLRAARNGRLVVVPGAKHVVSLEAPVALMRVVFELLDEVDGRRDAESWGS